jgi:hypothetical protein
VREQFETYEEWIKHDPPPEIEDLIKRFGSYGHVPNSSWIAHDEQFRRWNNRRITRHW